MKKINEMLKNKNVVTVLGLVAILVILYVGYSIRINQQVKLVDVYYALDTIQPMTEITEDMVGQTRVPESFILGRYYSNYNDIIGKYSSYNSKIAKGSLFYFDLIVDKQELPNSMFYSIQEGERVASYSVNVASTYGNSIMPNDLVDVYVKLVSGTEIVYGQFMDNVKVLAVKDSSGADVFQSSGNGVPSYIYFALPEAKYLLYSSLNYVAEEYANYGIEVVLVPNSAVYNSGGATEVSSSYLYNFVLNNIKTIDGQKNLYNELLNEMSN